MATMIFLAGPLKGSTRIVAEGETSIGRDDANQIAIADPALSRQHCVVRRDGDRLSIADRASLNGTFVNGIPVTERVLGNGDQVRIGDSVFVCSMVPGATPSRALAPDAPWAAVAEVAWDDDRGLAAAQTIELRPAEARYATANLVDALAVEQPATASRAAEHPSARAARDLKTLLAISSVVHVVRSPAALQEKILDLVLEAVPADYAAMLLDDGAEEFVAVVRSTRSGNEPAHVSRTIARRVFSTGAATLTNDFATDGPPAVASVVAAGVRSVLCAPLTVFARTLGVVYLASRQPRPFDRNDLEILCGIGGIAAVALENARHVDWLVSEAARLEGIEHNMVGGSPRMREVYNAIGRVAAADSTVLIRGESGTGKELAARAVHANSARAGKPFVSINCAALTETLLESELFGHERGAFTGAIAQKRGKLELADGGTLFLDEVGELSPSAQAKLLRVLQEREFERVGGTRPIKVDVRIVAATNRDLEAAIKTGSFRQDLFYRLNVVALTMPAVRERREDIALLTNYFIAKYSARCKRPVRGISSEARDCLLRYTWPGNVRELENAIERAVVMGSTEWIRPEDLPEAVLETESSGEPAIDSYHEALNDTKKRLIVNAVEQADGNYTEAAKRLGVHPNYLHRLIRNLNLKAHLKKL